jgi:hypothetical protein
MMRPEEWRDKSFDSTEFISAYIEFSIAVIEKFRIEYGVLPKYFNYASEVSELMINDIEKYSQFIKFSVDTKDRILLISGTYSSVYIYYKARDLFFLINDLQKGVYTSWEKKWTSLIENENLFDRFDVLDRQDILKNTDIGSIDNVFKHEYDFCKKMLEDNSKNKINFNLKKKKNINNDILLLKKTLEIKDQIIDLKNLSQLKDLNKFLHLKLRVKFSPEDNEHKKREKILDKLKHIELAIKIQEKRALLVLPDSSTGAGNREVSKIKVYNPMLYKKSEPLMHTSFAKEAKNYRVNNFDNFKIGVGLNARGNDQMRKEWASDHDYWVHVDGASSAHIILKIDNINYLNEALQECAKIYAQSAKIQEVNLVYCQVKNVKGKKGAAGLVSFKKEKRVKIYV